jgi:hypothetical protein
VKTLVIGVAAALFVAGNAHAASCEPSLFPQTLDLRPAQITVSKAALWNDPEACSRPVGVCPSKAYLLAGDAVVAAQTETDKTCVALIARERSTIGWADAAALAPMPPAPPAVDWTGHWSCSVGDAEATIERKGKSLTASLSPSAEGGRSDNVRTGGAVGDLMVHGDRGELTNRGDAGCRVHLRRIGAYLIINDGASDDANSHCGGSACR